MKSACNKLLCIKFNEGKCKFVRRENESKEFSFTASETFQSRDYLDQNFLKAYLKT